MVLTKVISPDLEEEFLCNICLEKVSVGDGIYLDETSTAFVCQKCKTENDL